MRILSTLTLAATLLALGIPSHAGILTVTWPEQNGPEDAPLPFTLDAGTLPFTVPAGQTIVAALFESTLGNTEVNSTAVMDVFVNGVLMGQCPNQAADCWQGTGSPIPFSHSYTALELASLSGGTADLTITQNDCCVIRLGESTLTITTSGETSVPEPGTVALFGIGLIGGAVMLRRFKPEHGQRG